MSREKEGNNKTGEKEGNIDWREGWEYVLERRKGIGIGEKEGDGLERRKGTGIGKNEEKKGLERRTGYIVYSILEGRIGLGIGEKEGNNI